MAWDNFPSRLFAQQYRFASPIIVEAERVRAEVPLVDGAPAEALPLVQPERLHQRFAVIAWHAARVADHNRLVDDIVST